MKSKVISKGCKKVLPAIAAGVVGVMGMTGEANAYLDAAVVNVQAEDTTAQSTQSESKSTVRTLTSNISTSVRNVIASKIEVGANGASTSGVNTGDENGKFLGLFENVWGSLDMTHSGTTPWDKKQLQNDSDSYAVSFGMDTSVSDQLIAGLAVSMVKSDAMVGTDISGQFINQKNTSYAVVPYLAYLLNDNYYFSALAGYSRSSVRNEFLNTAKLSVGESEYAPKTFLFSGEGNYLNTYSNVDFQASLGFSFTNTHLPEYIDSTGVRNLQTNKTQQSYYTALQATYPDFASYKDLGVIPMARVALEYDKNLSGVGNGAVRTTVGVSKDFQDIFNLSLEGNHMFREHQSETGVLMNVNVAF